jgi:hypothetical protein
MLHIEYGPKVRVTCASPRTNENYESVDAALVAAFEEVVK